MHYVECVGRFVSILWGFFVHKLHFAGLTWIEIIGFDCSFLGGAFLDLHITISVTKYINSVVGRSYDRGDETEIFTFATFVNAVLDFFVTEQFLLLSEPIAVKVRKADVKYFAAVKLCKLITVIS